MAQKQKGVAGAVIEADQWVSNVESSSLRDFLLLQPVDEVSSPAVDSNNISNIKYLRFYH